MLRNWQRFSDGGNTGLGKTMDEVVFEVADYLRRAGRFCGTLARVNAKRFFERGLVPRPDDATATVTFVEVSGKAYAVTAHHVIRILEAEAEYDGNRFEGYQVPVAPGLLLPYGFVQPPGTIIHPAPDVAMIPIDGALPGRIGQEIYKVEDRQPASQVLFGLAAGFPTLHKYEQADRRLALQSMVMLAESVGSSEHSDQMQFYSEVPRERLRGDVSGMSGGPVFWSEGEDHGLLGFVKEAMAQPLTERTCRVNFICQRAPFATLASWAKYTDEEFPQKRKRATHEMRS